MFKKVCPYCHEDSYSASGVGNWVCPYCSQNITDVQPETAGYNKHYPVNIAKEDMKHGKENKK